MPKKLLSFLIVSLWFLSLIAQDFSKNSIPENLSKNADAVVRFEDYSIDLVSSDKMIKHYKTAITIYNKTADYLARPTLGYDKHNLIKALNMEFYNADGNSIKKVKKKDFKDYAAVDGFSLYTDNRLIHYEYIPISYPYTVYYEYELHSKNTAFIPSWYPVGGFNIGVIKSNYSFKHPTDIKIQKLESNFEGFTITKSESTTSVNYKITNVLPIKEEALSFSYSKIFPKVKLASNTFFLAGVRGAANNWQEYGKWVYDKLLVNRNNLSQLTKDKVKEMVKGVSDPIERAKIIYEYVQNKTRYINIAIGIGGWQPMKTNEVDQLGYGDCKALTFYTKSLFDVAEVPSFYTIVNSDTDKTDIDKRSVTLQGNHVFLCLPTQKDTIWLECTSQKLPFGFINTTTDDRDVLLITPKGGKIVHTTTNPSEDNLQKTTATYSIDNKGNIQGEAEIVSYGTQYRNHLGSFEGLTPLELENSMKEYFDFINNLSFSNISVTNNKLEKRFEESIAFSADNYTLINSDGSMLLTLNALNRLLHIPKREKNRKTPFEIPRGYQDVDEYTINLPQEYKLIGLPKPIKIENEFGIYSLSVETLSETALLYSRSFLLHKGLYAKEKYETYRKFRKQVKKYENLKIILQKDKD